MDEGRTTKRWTQREDYIAKKMQRDGKTYKEIGAFLKRSRGSVAGRLWLQSRDSEQLEQRAERARVYRSRNGRSDYIATRHLFPREHLSFVRPDPLAIAERDACMSLPPRDLTAALLGDPLPGRSALDRR